MNCVQMLYSTSLLGLVGAGQQASFSPRRLQLFNTSEQKMICEFNFVSSILNVLMTRKRLVVVLECRIHLFDISTMKILRTIETASNKKGICALVEHGSEETNNYISFLAYPYGTNMISSSSSSSSSGSASSSSSSSGVLSSSLPTSSMMSAHVTSSSSPSLSSASPSNATLSSSVGSHSGNGGGMMGGNRGSLNLGSGGGGNLINNSSGNSGDDKSQLLGDIVIMDAISGRPLNAIRAHKGKLSTIQFNRDGTLLATASEKGTVIRVFSVLNASQLCTLRRGSYAATIYSIAFSSDSSLLSVSSDKGTVHVFKLAKGYYSGSLTYDSSDSLSSSPSASELLSESHPQKRKQIGTLSDTIGNLWDSVRDFAHAKVKFTNSMDSRNICGITPSGNTLMVMTFDGYLHKFSLDLVNGGEAKLENSYSLFG